MIFKLFSFKKKVDPRIDPIYTALVEQSRVYGLRSVTYDSDD